MQNKCGCNTETTNARNRWLHFYKIRVKPPMQEKGGCDTETTNARANNASVGG